MEHFFSEHRAQELRSQHEGEERCYWCTQRGIWVFYDNDGWYTACFTCGTVNGYTPKRTALFKWHVDITKPFSIMGIIYGRKS